MKLSIVIVNWNTRDLLRQCLTSIYADPPVFDFDVYLVDNASTDGSAAMVQEQFSQVRLLTNAANVGFARANNQAIRLSTADYVLLLNSDTVVKPGALMALTHFMETHPQAGIAGARLVNPDGSLQLSCSPFPCLWRELFRLLHIPPIRPDGYYPMAGWDQAAPRSVDVVLGACMFLRKAALDRIGLMDEDFFMYSEEVDLCYRFKDSGWNIFWVPQAEILHYGGQSTRQVATEMFLRLYQSKVLYFRKHAGWFTVQVYKMILALAALARLAVVSVLNLWSSSRKQQQLALMERYHRLLLALPGL